MTFNALTAVARALVPTLFMERIFPHRLRKRLLALIRPLFFLCVLGALSLAMFMPGSGFDDIAIGLGLIIFSIALFLFCIEAHYFSRFAHFMWDVPYPTLPLAVTICESDLRDLVGSFLVSRHGSRLLMRIGADPSSLQAFVSSSRAGVDPRQLQIKEGAIGLGEYAAALFDADSGLATFVLRFGIDRPAFIDVARWVDDEALLAFRGERWWSTTFLIKGGGLGESITYGRTRSLDRYAQSIHIGETLLPGSLSAEEMRDTEKIEQALARVEEPHCILVSDDRQELLDILSRIAERIDERQTVPSLQHRHVMLMDANALLADTDSIEALERKLVGAMNEAEAAGNLILAIESFAALIRYAEAHQADLGDMLGESLASGQLPLIALATRADFHSHIDEAHKLTQHFEVVRIESKEGGALLRALQEQCMRIESKTGVLYSIQALKELAQSLGQHFLGEIESDTARDILMSLPSEAAKAGRSVITRDDVASVVSKKTGAPAGKIGADEQEKLLHLEDILHEKIIGQDEAVSAVARAMRRARTSLQSAKRPLGSFLFLGSTGVGKTETAKALASVFFGDSDQMLRLDMSEYAGADGLQKLIGSTATGAGGTLTALLRDRQYGVLLLDEFEKAAPDVHNIFLQVLDEGFFSDPSGMQINARNTIIIATSNAGGDLIWDLLQKGSVLADHRDEIIDHLVSNAIFRPELINRFDDVVLFHPLAAEHLKRIAELLLAQLGKNLASKGFHLIIKPELTDFVVKQGSDPQFGARPMRRAIQDTLEEAIARAIIANAIKPGDSISFKPRSDKSEALDVVVV